MKEKNIEKENSIEEWDKVRIGIGVIIVILLIAGWVFEKNYILGLVGIHSSTQSVQGSSTINLPSGDKATVSHVNYSLPTSNDVANKIQQLQQQVSHVNIADIASASPQIQQVIQQLQALPQLPGSVAKQQCLQICSKL